MISEVKCLLIEQGNELSFWRVNCKPHFILSLLHCWSGWIETLYCSYQGSNNSQEMISHTFLTDFSATDGLSVWISSCCQSIWGCYEAVSIWQMPFELVTKQRPIVQHMCGKTMHQLRNSNLESCIFTTCTSVQFENTFIATKNIFTRNDLVTPVYAGVLLVVMADSFDTQHNLTMDSIISASNSGPHM